jgi:hypothetical protein
MASLIASVGDLAEITSGSQLLVVVPVPGLLCVGGASQGATSIRVVGAGPQLVDDAESLL